LLYHGALPAVFAGARKTEQGKKISGRRWFLKKGKRKKGQKGREKIMMSGMGFPEKRGEKRELWRWEKAVVPFGEEG